MPAKVCCYGNPDPTCRSVVCHGNVDGDAAGIVNPADIDYFRAFKNTHNTQANRVT